MKLKKYTNEKYQILEYIKILKVYTLNIKDIKYE